MSSSRNRAPKRDISRFKLRISKTVPTTASDEVIHTSTQSETLVRLLVDGTLQINSSAVADQRVNVEMMLRRNPGGNVTINPTAVASGEEGVQQDEIAASLWAVGMMNVEQYTYLPLYRDIKAMRKCKVNDEIAFSLIAGAANIAAFTGVIYAWYKE